MIIATTTLAGLIKDASLTHRVVAQLAEALSIPAAAVRRALHAIAGIKGMSADPLSVSAVRRRADAAPTFAALIRPTLPISIAVKHGSLRSALPILIVSGPLMAEADPVGAVTEEATVDARAAVRGVVVDRARVYGLKDAEIVPDLRVVDGRLNEERVLLLISFIVHLRFNEA